MTDLMLFTFTDQIIRGAKASGQRTGQYLFNHLPDGASIVVAGKLFDPFHRDLSPDQIQEWIDNHLIFDNGQIIACFNRNSILWEEK